jgi:hypothetical protein
LDHPSPPSPPPSLAQDFFQPTRGRALLAIAVAVVAFLMPQEAPLAYYPLNNPSDGLLLLEITCAASATGETQIFYDTGRRFNQLNSIRIPISPSSQPFTYTFPLPDAPIVAMRLNPLNCPGELIITNFRIINRRGEMIRRMVQDDFQPTNEIAAIAPISGGWKLVTTPAAKQPFSRIELHEPIIAQGMNVRNLQRCLLSWGYLSLMLWILLLAVYFALRQGQELGVRSQNPGGGIADAESDLPRFSPNLQRGDGGWRLMVRSVLFLAGIALLFSAVGNRRLIKEAVRYANFQLVPRILTLRLEIDLAVNRPVQAQLFWDTGHGFNEDDSLRRNYEPNSNVQTLSFDLPIGRPIRALRFDPFDAAGEIRLVGIRVMDSPWHTRLRLPVTALHSSQQIATFEVRDDQAVIRTTPDATDPILEFTPDAAGAVSQLMIQEGKSGGGGKSR